MTKLLCVTWMVTGLLAAQELPVKRVVLYKNGVGYFEHVGKINGNQNVTIPFTTGQLNEIGRAHV